VYGSRAYRAGRRAAAARNSASAADATAAAAQAAYDALYRRCAADVTRHTFLLTGDHALTREAVEHAFHLAWERWPEVASDRDPPGWVRAAAFEYVQEPWEWLRARWRRRAARGRGAKEDAHAAEPGGEAEDRRLFTALLALPASYRSAVVVYDVVGLGLPETAAELEATTLAAAGRLTHAHEALAAAVPELGQLPPDERAEALRTRLRRFAAAQPIRTLPPGAARHRSERRTDRQLRGYALLTAALFLAATAVTALGEDHTRDKSTPPPPPRPATRTAHPSAQVVGTPTTPPHITPAARGTGTHPAPHHVTPAPPGTGTPPAPVHRPPA
jgi:DNA-directed RNA polymerase specialized sigma24 family protein